MMMTLSPKTHPLYTIVRSDSPSVNQQYLDLLPIPQTKAHDYLRLPGPKPPAVFEGRRQWKGLLTPIQNQKSCGGCYAFASSAALADQYNIQSNGGYHLNLSASRIILCNILDKEKDVYLEPKEETAIVRAATQKYGCNGHSLMEAWIYLYTIGTNEEKCFPNDVLFQRPFPSCESITGNVYDMCEDGKTPARFYRARHIYAVPGIPEEGGDEEEIRKHIYKFGPLSTAMTIYEDFYTFEPKKSIYHRSPTSKRLFGHAVVLDGWGEENGEKFWWIRNSWGPDWGDAGYFRMPRGTNYCDIESNVIGGVPAMVDRVYSPPVFEDIYLDPRTREIVLAAYAPQGGIDRNTGISRRLLSYERNTNAKTFPTIHQNWETFQGGEVSAPIINKPNSTIPISPHHHWWVYILLFGVLLFILFKTNDW